MPSFSQKSAELQNATYRKILSRQGLENVVVVLVLVLVAVAIVVIVTVVTVIVSAVMVSHTVVLLVQSWAQPVECNIVCCLFGHFLLMSASAQLSP